MSNFCPRCGSENVRSLAADAPTGVFSVLRAWLSSIAAYFFGFIEFGSSGQMGCGLSAAASATKIGSACAPWLGSMQVPLPSRRAGPPDSAWAK